MHKMIADYLYRGVDLWLEQGRINYRIRPGVQTEELMQELAARKPELLQQLSDHDAKSAWYPVTENQRALLLHQSLYPNDSSYNVALTLKLPQPVTHARFGAVLTGLIARHPSLARIYEWSGQNGYQKVGIAADAVNFETRGFSSETQFATDIEAFKTLPFNLSEGALLRVALDAVSTDAGKEQFCTFVIHHLNVDFWSLGLIIRDLVSALAEDGAIVPGDSQDEDVFIRHVRSKFVSAEPKEQMLYWERQIADHYRPYSLPEHTASGQATTHGESSHFVFAPELKSRVDQTARELGVSPFIVVLSAYFLLLRNISGSNSISVCTPTFGRAADERDTIGYFVNPLPIILDFDAIHDTHQLFFVLKQRVLEILDIDKVPYSDIITSVRNKFNDVAGREFPAFLNWNSLPNFDGINNLLDAVTIDQVGGFCNLMLTVTELRDEYSAAWTFDERSKPYIERWHGFFLEILNSVSKADAQPIKALPVISSDDRTLIETVNATQVDYGAAASIVELIVRTCRAFPSAVALKFNGYSLSYAELDELSKRLASRLIQSGVTNGVFVGICCERSLEMMVSLVAILRAGAAFVPLDSSYPTRRLVQMIADAGLSTIVTSVDLQHVEALQTCQRIPVDIAELAASGFAPETVDRIMPSAPAYMLYTSGSTGVPKGAVIQHQAILNRLMWMQAEYRLVKGDHVLQKTPYSFDVSIWEFFWPLMFGATLVVAKPEGHKNPEYIIKTIKEERITHLHFVPPMLEVYLDYVDAPNDDTSLKCVFCSGEALLPGLVKKFFALYPKVQLHNLYGPTEAAIDVSYYACHPVDSSRATIPIGKPVANTQLHILRPDMSPAPVGSAGELYLEGIQLSSGYFGRDDLNRTAFVETHIAGFGDALRRLYKTGDLARWNNDGDVEYLGRIDHQVKIRGQRVELGEIDSAIEQLDCVRKATTLIDQKRADPLIISFVVLQDGEAPQNIMRDIRDSLMENLPSHMVPSAIQLAPGLPTTSNGKLDRAALLAGYYDAQQSNAAETPEHALDTHPELLAAWKSVLGDRQTWSTGSNFFLVGGDSIKALRLIGMLRKQNILLDAYALYKFPTLGEIDRIVKNQLSDRNSFEKTGGVAEQPIKPFSLGANTQLFAAVPTLTDVYPLTTLQEVMYVQSLLNRNAAIYHDVFVVHLASAVDPDLLGAFIRNMAEEHETLRTRVFEAQDGTLLQKVLTQVQPDFDAVTVPDALSFDAYLEKCVAELKREPFDVSASNLIRFKYVAHHRQNALVICFHHLILDGWSVASLIFQLFASLGAKRFISRKRSDYRFADYVALEAKAAASPASQAYWQSVLTDVGPALLGTDRHNRLSFSQDDIAHIDVEVTPELERSLRSRATQLGVSLKSVALAAHSIVLMKFLGRQDIVTAYVVDGRPEFPNYEFVLGLHLNTLPLVVRAPGKSLLELIQTITGQEVENLPHRRYPFYHITRDIGGWKLLNTVFNFTNFHVYGEDAAGEAIVQNIDVHEFTDFDFVSSFSIHPRTDRFRLRIDYNRKVLNAIELEQLRAIYDRVLRFLAESPLDSAMEQILGIDELDRQLLEALNNAQGISSAAIEPADAGDKRTLRIIPTSEALPQLSYFDSSPYLTRHTLPNDMEVAIINRPETDFNYREVFADNLLSRIDLQLSANPVIFDVGANIGLFTLYMYNEFPSARFFAYEPVDEIAAKLSANLEAYRVPANLSKKALSREQGVGWLTFYENNTLISGLYTNQDDVDVSVKALMNTHGIEDSDDEENGELRQYIEEKLVQRDVSVEIATLSSEIACADVAKIDLLKIDVEKAEMDVLQGIAAEHWPLISNVLIEVHDLDNRLRTVIDLLETHGYFVYVEQEALLTDTNIYNLFASRAPIEMRTAAQTTPWRYSAKAFENTIKTLTETCVGADAHKFEIELLADNQTGKKQAVNRAEARAKLPCPAPSQTDANLFNGVWAAVFGKEIPDFNTSLYDLGVDSISLLKLLRKTNIAFGYNIPVAAVNIEITPSELLALGRQNRNALSMRTVTEKTGAKTLVFIVPYATSFTVYDDLIAEVSSIFSIKILSISEHIYSDSNLGQIAEHFNGDWHQAVDHSTVLVGWSLGGNLALAMSEYFAALTGKSLPVVLIDNYFIDPSRLNIDEAAIKFVMNNKDDPFFATRINLLGSYMPSKPIQTGLYIKASRNAFKSNAEVLQGCRFIENHLAVEIDAGHYDILEKSTTGELAAVIRHFALHDLADR